MWLIDRTLLGTTIQGHSGPESNDREGVLNIRRIFYTGASQSDCLMLYPGHSLEAGSYPSAERQSVYSAPPADWAGTNGGYVNAQIFL